MQPLVSVDWLSANRAGVIVLDASVTRIDRGAGVTAFAPGPEGFAKAHIPGARFADLMGAFSDAQAPFGFTAPTLAQLQQAARAVGISDDSRVVIYDSLGGAYAARLRYLLRGHGLRDVAVLNGGLQAWKAAGYPVETGMDAAPETGNFTPVANDGLFTDTAAVLAHVNAPDPSRPLICALRAPQFDAGHIPHSLNLPYPAILDGEGLLDVTLLEKALQDLGLGHDIAPVLYCGGGINAAGLALGFELLGLENVVIYDDSMSGWRADPALPIETHDV